MRIADLRAICRGDARQDRRGGDRGRQEGGLGQGRLSGPIVLQQGGPEREGPAGRQGRAEKLGAIGVEDGELFIKLMKDKIQPLHFRNAAGQVVA